MVAAAGLAIGLTAAVFPANILFLAGGLVWLRGVAPRLALAAGFCVGAWLSPTLPAEIVTPRPIDQTMTVSSAPTMLPGGGSEFLADGAHLRLEVVSRLATPVLGDEVLIQGTATSLSQERERTYLARGVSGVVKGQVTVVQRAGGLAAWGARWRESFLSYTSKHLSPVDSGVAAALAFDVRTGLRPDVRQALEQSGTVHVLAASGLHLFALAWILELAGSRLPLHYLIRRIIILSLLILYSAAGGFHPGTFRAVVATGLRDGAVVAGREYDALSGIGLAAAIYLLWRPTMVFDAGFQLSMILGIGIAMFGARSAGMAPLARLVKGGLVGWLVSIPIVANLFGLVSLVSVPANVVATGLLPICLLFLLAGHAASFVSGLAADVLLVPATVAAHALEWVVGTLGLSRFWGFQVPEFSGYWVGAVYGCAALLWRPKARPVD